MEKQESAVNWLIDEAMKLVVQYMQGTLNEDTLDEVIYELGTKAKEMEKEQSECICVNVISKILDESEQGKEINSKEIFEDVYKQTFKSE